MSFSTGNSSQTSEINVTPLIDVLLVLLIIFMVLVPLHPVGLPALIPQPAPPAVVVAEKPRRGRFGIFVLGFLLGAIALFALALFASLPDF